MKKNLIVSGHNEKGVEGRWLNVQIKPDPAVADRLNAGVAFIDDQGRIHIRMARDFSRLKCLYDEFINIESFARTAGYIEDAFSGSNFDPAMMRRFSDSVCLTESKYASGTNIKDILNQLFQHTVPLGRGRSLEEIPVLDDRAERVPPGKFRSSMIAKVRSNLSPFKQRFVGHKAVLFTDDSGNERKLDIPIREPGKLAASLVSVWTKNEYKRKYSLYHAGIDLDALHSKSSDEKLGLFVLRPFGITKGYDSGLLNRIDDEIDEARWKLRRIADVNLESSGDEDDLAKKVSSWVEAA